LLRVLKPHGDMKPVRDRWCPDTGVGQNRSQAGAAVGERGQLRGSGSANRLKISADQHRDIGIGPRDSAKYLPASVGRFDVTDADLAWGDDCQAFSCLWHATVTPLWLLCCFRDDQRGALPLGADTRHNLAFGDPSGVWNHDAAMRIGGGLRGGRSILQDRPRIVRARFACGSPPPRIVIGSSSCGTNAETLCFATSSFKLTSDAGQRPAALRRSRGTAIAQ
jgi:hypothetical protein